MEVEELARLQGSLEQFDWLGSVPQALAAERVRFVQLANEARSMSAKERSELGARVELSRVEYWWTVFKGDFNAGYREASGVLSLLNRQIEDVARSMDSPAAMRTLPDKLAPPDGYWRELGFLAKAIRGYDRGLKQLFHIESQRRMAVLRIAAERFRLRHGRYPERAEDLVPEFLAAVPLDPLDGQPVRYRIGENGKPFLHCVGLDGVDQGGAGDALDDSGSSPDWPWPQIATTPAEEVAP
jgi:hypothetical protein